MDNRRRSPYPRSGPEEVCRRATTVVRKKNLVEGDLPLDHSRIRDEVCYRFPEEDQRACHAFMKYHGRELERLLMIRTPRLSTEDVCEQMDLDDLDAAYATDREGMLSRVGARVSDMAKNAYGKTEEMAEAALNKGREAEEWVVGKGERAWGRLQDKGERAREEAREDLEDLGESARRTGRQLRDSAKRKSREVKEGAEEMMDEGRDRLHDAQESARRARRRSGGWAREEGGERIRRGAHDLSEDVREDADRMGQAMWNTEKDIRRKGEEVGERARRRGRQMGDSMREMKEDARETFDDARRSGKAKAHEMRHEGEDIANRTRKTGKRNKEDYERDESIVDRFGDKINELTTDMASWWRGDQRNKDN